MDRGAPMKGESARRNLLNHPPETSFQRRARLAAQEEADRLAVIWWAIGLTFVTAALLVLCLWLVVR